MPHPISSQPEPHSHPLCRQLTGEHHTGPRSEVTLKCSCAQDHSSCPALPTPRVSESECSAEKPAGHLKSAILVRKSHPRLWQLSCLLLATPEGMAIHSGMMSATCGQLNKLILQEIVSCYGETLVTISCSWFNLLSLHQTNGLKDSIHLFISLYMYIYIIFLLK